MAKGDHDGLNELRGRAVLELGGPGTHGESLNTHYT